MKYSISSMLIFFLLFSSSFGCQVNHSKKEIAIENIAQPEPNQAFAENPNYLAITIDDLPGISLNSYQEVNDKLLTTLKKFKVTAVGFVNEGKLYPKNKLDQSRLDILEDWLKAGMELGNHTFSHFDYNKLSFEEFTSDLLKGEKHTKQLQSKDGSPMRYFRHPYLHVGNSADKKKRLEQFLVQQEYISAPVTIDNSEWIFAKAYHLSLQKKDAEQMKKVGNSYVQYMEEMTVFFEKKSIELFGRPIKHTLLIHANALNADYLDELLEMYQRKGYQFISLEDALTDTAYNSTDDYAGKGGISWLHRWALTQNPDYSFFKGEPTCPDFIEKITGIKD